MGGHDIVFAAGDDPDLIRRCEFHDRPLSPAVLRAGEGLDLADQAEIGRENPVAGPENADRSRELSII